MQYNTIGTCSLAAHCKHYRVYGAALYCTVQYTTTGNHIEARALSLARRIGTCLALWALDGTLPGGTVEHSTVSTVPR
jgi:hypothetical protein